MPSLRLNDVSFHYPTGIPLFERASLHVDAGWTGIVGANGCGKTTLLRLIAGELTPSTGTIVLHPRGHLLFCRQSVERLTPEIESFAASVTGEALALQGRLRLEPDDLSRWQTLSPGERKRWQIGAALATSPPFLLLDEPTNHLDVEAKGLLVAALRRFRGVGLVVSHDRSVLNALTRDTIRVARGSLVLWTGGYDAAREAWEAQEHETSAAYDQLDRERRKLERRLADGKRKIAQGSARRRSAVRQAGTKNSDARSMEASIRAAGGERRSTQDVSTTRDRIERVGDSLEKFRFAKDVGRSLFFDYEPCPKECIVQLDGDDVRAGDHVVLSGVRCDVRRDARVRLAGPNGAGKTTLLEALAARSTIPPERLLYLPQEISEDEGARLLRAVKELPTEERGRVLSLVAALGLDPDVLLASATPSPGEARKLKIAYGLGTRVWCLFLDEPTNHLDLPAIERLQEALQSCPAALVLVTHDDPLADAVTREVWEIDGEAGALKRSG